MLASPSELAASPGKTHRSKLFSLSTLLNTASWNALERLGLGAEVPGVETTVGALLSTLETTVGALLSTLGLLLLRRRPSRVAAAFASAVTPVSKGDVAAAAAANTLPPERKEGGTERKSGAVSMLCQLMGCARSDIPSWGQSVDRGLAN
jgi:hypothetical protein